MKTKIALLLAFLTTSAWATGTLKQIDNIQNSTGGAELAVPSVGTSLLTDTNTVSVFNKTFSGAGTGANTFTNIPVSAIATGTGLGVASGGTGDTSFTLNGVLFGGGGTAALSVSGAGSQYEVFRAGASGVPAFGSIDLSQSLAVGSSVLGVGNGGLGVANPSAHYVLIGEGSSPVTPVAPGTSGYVLTSNGGSADPSFQAIPSTGPTVNNSVASPQSVTAVGGVSLSAPTNFNIVFAKGGTPSSTVTVTATPSITACTSAGQQLIVVSESATALFTLQADADLVGSQLLINGPWTSGENNGNPNTITFSCDGAGTPHWVEIARNN